MKACVNSTVLILRRKDSQIQAVRDQFSVSNLWEVTPEIYDAFEQWYLSTPGTNKELMAGIMRQNFQKYQFMESKLETQPTQVEDSVVSDVLDPVTVESEFMFASKQDAERALFKGQEAALLAYHNFMHKHLIEHFFLTLNREQQITTDKQLHKAIHDYINGLQRIIIHKPILDLRYRRVELIKENYYELNQRINELLANKSNLAVFNPDPKNPDSGLKTVNGKIVNPQARLYMAAVTYANFNTILKEYLPVMDIESDYPGFDAENIKNLNTYKLSQKTQPKGSGFQDENLVMDRNSRLAKLIITSFKKQNAYISNDTLHVDFSVEPAISIANYYYVMQIVSNHTTSTNYNNDQNRLLTALVAYNIKENGTRLIDKLPKSSIGHFDSDYILKHEDLKKLFSNNTLLTTLVSLYRNLALTDNDPLLSRFVPKNNPDMLVNAFSIRKYYDKFSKSTDFHKNNLFDIIYGTFQQTTPRNYHDVVYNSKFRVNLTESSEQRVRNTRIFDVLKAHRNLQGRTPQIHNSYLGAIEDSKMTLKVDGSEVKLTYLDGKWYGASTQKIKEVIYEVFRQMTNINLDYEPMLKTNPSFSIDKILSVIYAFGNLYQKSLTDTSAQRLITLNEPLKNSWDSYAVSKSKGGTESILMGMAKQYSEHFGGTSKMTVLSKDGKPLPTYGNVAMLFNYRNRLNFFQGRPGLRTGNIFILNPNLLMGVSAKNQISIDGKVVDYRAQNLNDQIITDVLLEWFQKRNVIVDTRDSVDKQSSNEERAVHFQPIVYSDKTQQEVIKINLDQPILFIDGRDPYSVQTLRFDKARMFTHEFVSEVQNAAFQSLGYQYQSYYNYTIQGLNNIINGLTVGTNISRPWLNVREPSERLRIMMGTIETLLNTMEGDPITVVDAWRTYNPKEPLIKDMVFSRNKLNEVQLFFYDLYADPDLFKSFGNLGLIQFLQELSRKNINQASGSLKIFAKTGDPLAKDMSTINDPALKRELLQLNRDITEMVANTTHSDLFNLNLILQESGIESRINELLPKLSAVYQQYYWENLLFSHNFELSANGPIFLHSTKSEQIATQYSTLAQQLANSEKRNVTLQGTVIPYTMNSIIGIPAVRTVISYKDPKSRLSNPMGETGLVDNHDGGEYVTLLQRILENNSMPAYNNPKHHKAFIPGVVFSGDTALNANIFKYASFSLNNLRLRQSENYQNLVKTALDREIPFSHRIDLTKDYNGELIDYATYNLKFEDPIRGIMILKGLFKVNPQDSNDMQYEVHLQSETDGAVYKEQFVFSSLYQLYTTFGKHMSIDNSSGEMLYSDQVWYVLADVVNRVGFRLKPEDFENGVQQQYQILSTNKLEDLRLQQSDFADSQMKVVQPLKFAFIHSILPDSCVKFGNIEPIDVNYFKNPIKDPVTFQMSNLHQGIQQDTEHEKDQVTEVTQMINGMQLDNATPELLGLYRDIAQHIKLSMGVYYNSYDPILEFDPTKTDIDQFKAHIKQLVYIYKRLQNQVLNSSYNIGQTQSYLLGTIANFVKQYEELNANSILSRAERDRELFRIFDNSFRASLSDQNVYNSFITTLASVNTKIGIRRKSQGDSPVLTPHSGFMSFIAIPRVIGDRIDDTHYATLTPLQFEEHLRKHPEYNILLDQRYRLVYSIAEGVGEFDLSLFNHYRVDGSEIVYISNFQELEQLKDRLYSGKIISLEKDLLSGYVPASERQFAKHTIGRPLVPQNFKITVEASPSQKRIYSIYDTVSTKLLFGLKDNLLSIDAVKQEIRKNNFLKLNESYLTSIQDKEILTNVLRKMLSFEYRMMSEGTKIPSEEDGRFIALPNNQFALNIDNLYKITSIKSIDAEVIAGYHYADRFGIKNTENILDITVDRIKNEMISEVKEVEYVFLRQAGRGKRKPYEIPFYMHQSNGNIYFFDSSKVSRFNIKPLSDHFIKVRDERRFVEFIPGKPIIEITPELEGRMFVTETEQGNNVLLFDLKSKQDFNYNFVRSLKANVDSVNDSREEVVFIENISEEVTQPRKDLEGEITSVLNEVFDMYPKYKILEMGSETEQVFHNIGSLAEAKHSSFLASLRHASSRIPGQSYQSFAQIRLTNFLHDEQNSMLVSDYNIWLTGGDFDIDKLYNMGYFLTPKGLFVGWNYMFNLSSYEHLEQSLRLPESNPEIKVHATTGDLSNVVDFRTESVQAILKRVFQLRSKIIENNKVYSIRKLNNVNINVFRQFVELYNDMIKNGVVLDREDEFSNLVLEVLTSADFKPQDIQQQLENKIVYQTRQNLSHINNVVPLYSPISLDGPKALKEDPSNINGSVQKLTHMWNPIRRPQAIHNQYAGKNVVGINAAGLKIYATISYVTEKFLQDKNPEQVNELKKLLFRTKTTNQNTVRYAFAGIMYDMSPDILAKFTEQLSLLSDEDFAEMKNQILMELQSQIESSHGLDSVQLQISSLISAATDNGKEMILGIINQGEETQGAYIYGLALGYSLKEIGDVMISEPVNLILNMSKQSILLGESFRSILSVTNYFYEGVNFRHFIPAGATRNLMQTLGMRSADFAALSADEVRRKIAENESILRSVEVEYTSDEYQDYEDFGYDQLYEDTSNKITYDAFEALTNYAEVMDTVDRLKANGALDKVNIFAKLIDGSAILAGTTQILSSNQRIPTSDRAILSMINNFQDMIRNSLRLRSLDDGEPIPFLSRMNDFQKPLDSYEEGLIKNFDLRRFMLDDDYQNVLINAYNKIKNDLNPLHLIYHAEHFREMIRVIVNTDQLNQKYSLMYRSLKEFLDKHPSQTERHSTFILDNGAVELHKTLNTNHKLNEPAFNVLKSIHDDVYIRSTLNELQKELLQTKRTIRIEHEDANDVIVNLAELTKVEGSNQVGRKEFIQFMEQKFIPRLKEGFISTDQSEQILEIKNNKFVRDLVLTDFRIRTKRGKYFTAYGIQIPKVTDDLQQKIKQNELQKQLYDLKGYRYSNGDYVGQSVVDLLFLYNLIVHRKKEGEYTLTAFFDPERLDNSIMNVFLNKQVKINDSLSILEVSDEDLSKNGFDSSLDYQIDMINNFDEANYKFINVSTNQTAMQIGLTQQVTLQDKLAYIGKIIGSSELEFKFECE